MQMQTAAALSRKESLPKQQSRRDRVVFWLNRCKEYLLLELLNLLEPRRISHQ